MKNTWTIFSSVIVCETLGIDIRAENEGNDFCHDNQIDVNV